MRRPISATFQPKTTRPSESPRSTSTSLGGLPFALFAKDGHLPSARPCLPPPSCFDCKPKEGRCEISEPTVTIDRRLHLATPSASQPLVRPLVFVDVHVLGVDHVALLLVLTLG